MKKPVLSAALAAAIALPAAAQEEAKPSYPSPNEIVDKAEAKDWVTIAPQDLLVMDLAADRDGKPRRVVIQLMPAPFSQGWVRNIRKLASAHWYDGTAIVRVQDNYVTQWGDPDGEDEAKRKKLPDGLEVMGEGNYLANMSSLPRTGPSIRDLFRNCKKKNCSISDLPPEAQAALKRMQQSQLFDDSYAYAARFNFGWSLGYDADSRSIWPVHCYGMVGVGRGYSPDTGTGAELYTVIGHAPRHLDRNIALVGRIIEGMEHMSSLPRGTGPLGFYKDPAQHVPIKSVRLQSELEAERSPPTYEYLSTESETFTRYADARANRRDPFFIKPAGGADICNIPVPVRRKK